ncbi:MAG TPA: hypothetical protein VGJ16_12795 [Pirellulales bacterium]|jgi:hypothetical protein
MNDMKSSRLIIYLALRDETDRYRTDIVAWALPVQPRALSYSLLAPGENLARGN